MRQVSSQVMFLSSEKVKPQFHDQSEFCLIWSYVEHDFYFIFIYFYPVLYLLNESHQVQPKQSMKWKKTTTN